MLLWGPKLPERAEPVVAVVVWNSTCYLMVQCFQVMMAAKRHNRQGDKKPGTLRGMGPNAALSLHHSGHAAHGLGKRGIEGIGRGKICRLSP